jgi:hypothetical protein
MLLVMQTNAPAPDTEHTWFQKPMHLEDALGRPISIGPEFDFAASIRFIDSVQS